MNMSVSQDQINTLKDDIKRDGIQKVVVGAVIRRGDAVLLLKRQVDDFMGGLVELPSQAKNKAENLSDSATLGLNCGKSVSSRSPLSKRAVVSGQLEEYWIGYAKFNQDDQNRTQSLSLKKTELQSYHALVKNQI